MSLKYTLLLLSFVILVAFAPVPSFAAKGYKCKGQANTARFTGIFKKGCITVAGDSFRVKLNKNGNPQWTAYGETFVLIDGGIVTGRSGGKTGSHNCNFKSVVKAVKGES